ncbi:MAG: hypothetical protein ABL959_19575 [Pyrinomonadaceae bacterium]
MKDLLRILFISWMVCSATVTCFGQDPTLEIPAEVKPFIDKDMSALACESADLNGDGTKDYILVVETAASANDRNSEDDRTLIIITRETDGKLKRAKSNDNVVYCRGCGGAFGDPFDSVEVRKNSFTVVNYGGSAWRWSESYTFNYSRIDKTWQLVKSVSDSFNTLAPKTLKRKIRTPKNFGKVDIADFNTSKLK